MKNFKTSHKLVEACRKFEDLVLCGIEEGKEHILVDEKIDNVYKVFDYLRECTPFIEGQVILTESGEKIKLCWTQHIHDNWSKTEEGEKLFNLIENHMLRNLSVANYCQSYKKFCYRRYVPLSLANELHHRFSESGYQVQGYCLPKNEEYGLEIFVSRPKKRKAKKILKSRKMGGGCVKKNF